MVKIRELKDNMSNSSFEILMPPQPTLITLTSKRAMSIRLSRDFDACDGDSHFEYCSIEFHLPAKCITEQTLDVTSKDLYYSNHTIVPVDFSNPAG